ncbi:hypothetical protein BC834DRAFT_832569 [Gloeopeniophorella convolvens]|nr:hypothetical protein BC834DRAFT_832569 [Gloeopeniophorella convolvens]
MSISAPLDPSLLVLDSEEESFFKATTGIDDAAHLRKHIQHVARKAYNVFPYSSIGSYTFTKTMIARLPGYTEALTLGRATNGILLDAGCCFGVDVHKAAQDGWPAARIVATDIIAEFWELGHELFRSTEMTLPATFIQGDLLDGAHLSLGPPLDHTPELTSLTSLNQLRGHVTTIHASALFHLFSEEEQRALAVALGSLLAPIKGACVFGWSTGTAQVGNVEFAGAVSHPQQYCHSPSSWEALWNGGVYPRGSVEVKAQLVEFEGDIGLRLKDGSVPKRLEWVVKRV